MVVYSVLYKVGSKILSDRLSIQAKTKGLSLVALQFPIGFFAGIIKVVLTMTKTEI